MAGPFEFLHIKRRTEGSSNELSFDVLDAARNELTESKKRGRISPVGPRPSQGSYHGVTGMSALSSAPEVERRKRARRAHTARVWAIAIVAVAALVSVGVYLGFQVHRDKMDFNDHYASLVDRLVEADKTLVEIDDLMENPLTAAEGLYIHEETQKAEEATSEEDSPAFSYSASSEGREVEALANGFPSLKRELNAVSAESSRMKELAASDKDRAALSQVQIASEARLNMVSVGEEALDLMIETGKRMAKVNATWNKVLEADDKARDAAELANSASTEESTREAKEETEKARSLLFEAREELESLEKDEPKIGFSDEKNYVNKKIESLSAALRTSEALLSNNRDTATRANDEYTAADREAVALAMKLPPSEAKKVGSVYEKRFEEIEKAYDDGRATAANADSSIRSYLDSRP